MEKLPVLPGLFLRLILPGCILLFASLSSCHKETPAPASNSPSSALSVMDTLIGDTAFPIAYYPASPGSWWKYLTYTAQHTDSDTVIIQLDPGYHQFEYRYSRNADTVDNRIYRFWAPSLNGQPFLPDNIIHYCENNTNYHNFWLEPYLQLSPVSWASSCSCIPGYMSHAYNTSAPQSDTVLTVIYPNTIHVACNDYYSSLNTGPPNNRSWYAYNVGMIHKIIYDGQSNIESYMDLIDYNIVP